MLRSIVLAALIFTLPAEAALAQGCEVPPAWRPQEETIPVYAIAHVFRDSSGKSPIGSATIIDKRRRLLVTASHVVPGGTAFFRFPGFDSEMLKGTVLLRIPEANGDDEENGKAWGQPRDIVVIQADSALPAIAQSLDLRVLVHTTEKLSFYGFPTGTKTPMYGSGTAGEPSLPDQILADDAVRCTRVLREITQPGDSGAAIVSQSAYVVGVASQNLHRDLRNLFIPSSCFFNELIARVGESGSDGVYQSFTTKSKKAIAAELAADPEKSGISNIDLYIAAARLLRDKVATDKLLCPIMPMAMYRGVPLEALALMAADTDQKVAIADTITAVAAANKDQLFASDMRRFLGFSMTLYAQILQPRFDIGFVTIENARMQYSWRDAVILKSAADASLLLAKYSERPEPYNQFAAWASAVSATATPAKDLRAAAYASLGQAQMAQRQFEAALSAYNSAIAAGFSPEWVVSSQLRAKANIDPTSASVPIRDVIGTAIGNTPSKEWLPF